MMHGLIDLDFNEFFEFNTRNTRGHCRKLHIKRARLDVRKYFFCNRVTNIWNSLPPAAVEAGSLYQFKKEIRKIDYTRYLRGRTLMA